MFSITKGCATVQRKSQEFLKNQRGSVIEYVMIIALAGVFIGMARPTLTTLVENTVKQAETAIKTGTAPEKKTN